MKVEKDQQGVWILEQGETTIDNVLHIDNIDDWLIASPMPINNKELIVFNSRALDDGRLFSVVRRVREEGEYTGEIVIKGNISPDQTPFFARLGVSAFEFDDEKKAASAAVELNIYEKRPFYHKR